MVQLGIGVATPRLSDCPIESLDLVVINDLFPSPLNETVVPMEKTGDTSYKGSIQALPGSIVKFSYRIKPVGATASIDHQPSLFRMIAVSGYDDFQDILPGWDDCDLSPATGRITGKIHLAEKPVSGVWVQAGGLSALTHEDGSFEIRGAPAGQYHLQVIDPSGVTEPFRQLVLVEAERTTRTEILLQPGQLVNATFIVTVPEAFSVPGQPIHILADQTPLNIVRNRFTDLQISSESLPELIHQEGNVYYYNTLLPAGAVYHYRYSLGDAAWGGETNADLSMRERELIVPDSDFTINDAIQSFSDYTDQTPLLFRVKTPPATPLTDQVFIQLGQSEWTTPLAMYRVSDYVWEFKLTSGYDRTRPIHYRFCRNNLCGFADEVGTAGSSSTGWVLDQYPANGILNHEILAWQWLIKQDQTARVTVNATIKRQDYPTYLSGIEWSSCIYPGMEGTLHQDIENTLTQEPNWVILRPVFTEDNQLSYVIQQIHQWDYLDHFASAFQDNPKTIKSSTALFPTPISSNPGNTSLLVKENGIQNWEDWFQEYSQMMLDYAAFADRNHITALILGGEWITPYLPSDANPPGYESIAPGYADTRWVELIAEIRAKFDGRILFALPAGINFSDPPLFLDRTDGIYAILTQPEAYLPDLTVNLAHVMDTSVKNLSDIYQLPVILGINYPAISQIPDGASPSFGEPCIPPYSHGWLELTGTYPVDVQAQVNFYSVILYLINDRNWINGFVSQGFYPAVESHDYGSSIFSKPASQLVQYWNQSIFSTP